MTLIELLPYILSVFCYLVPICCFLPFRLSFRQKSVLSIILLIDILFIGFILGSIGILLLIASVCTYIALLSPNRLINICIIIATYLFCVVCDHIFRYFGTDLSFPLQSYSPTSYTILATYFYISFYCLASVL